VGSGGNKGTYPEGKKGRAGRHRKTQVMKLTHGTKVKKKRKIKKIKNKAEEIMKEDAALRATQRVT